MSWRPFGRDGAFLHLDGVILKLLDESCVVSPSLWGLAKRCAIAWS